MSAAWSRVFAFRESPGYKKIVRRDAKLLEKPIVFPQKAKPY